MSTRRDITKRPAIRRSVMLRRNDFNTTGTAAGGVASPGAIFGDPGTWDVLIFEGNALKTDRAVAVLPFTTAGVVNGSIHARFIFFQSGTDTNDIELGSLIYPVADNEGPSLASGAVLVNTTCNGNSGRIHVSGWSAPITFSATWAPGDILFYEISRISQTGNDDSASHCYLFAVEVSYLELDATVIVV